MDNILDAVLSSTGTYNRNARYDIVSEQHDTNAINWVGGLSDPGEMIACGYLPELRRRAGEQDAEYQTRIDPIVGRLPQEQQNTIKAAALRRFGVDTTTGKVAVMVVGEAAWHRLGVNVSAAVNAADAIRLASLDWRVSKRSLSFRRADGTYMESGDTFAIVRDDSEAMLGAVGSRYVPIQNADGFDFLDQVIGDFGAQYHTAGAIHGGAKIWMQCELPEHAFEVVRGDAVQAFATFTNPHDGSGKAWCFPTTNRIVCANTFRTASTQRSKGLGVRHTGNVKASIADARLALGIAVQEIDTFKDHAIEMAHQPIDAPQFFEDLLDAVLDVTAAEALKGADVLAAAVANTVAERELAAKRIQREIDRRENVLEEILNRYEGERNGIGGIRGTKWSAFNAVTEFSDHTKPRRRIGTEQERLSRQFESVLDGDADAIKQTAYEMLTTTVSA